MKPKVYVVDDDSNARMLVEIALSEEELELEIFENGSEFKARCIDELPNLAIVDVQLPDVMGTELCRWLKDGEEFVPVMLLTSHADLSAKLEGFDCGADDYITKPFQLPELVARVKAFLRIKELTDSLKRTRNLLAEKERELVIAQVAGAAAHELGQPLTAMLLDCEILSLMESTNPEFRETMEQVLAHCEKMREILDRLNRTSMYQTSDYVGGVQILDLND